MVVKVGLNLAIDKCIQKIIVEIDSTELFLILTNKCRMIDWRIRPLVFDIHKMLALILDSRVGLIKRDANAIADWEAVNTRKGMCMSGWKRQIILILIRIKINRAELWAAKRQALVILFCIRIVVIFCLY